MTQDLWHLIAAARIAENELRRLHVLCLQQSQRTIESADGLGAALKPFAGLTQ